MTECLPKLEMVFYGKKLDWIRKYRGTISEPFKNAEMVHHWGECFVSMSKYVMLRMYLPISGKFSQFRDNIFGKEKNSKTSIYMILLFTL